MSEINYGDNYKDKIKDKNIGLYVHIPFCRAKCHYCDFNSHAGMEDGIPVYMETLKKEIRLYSDMLKGNNITSVFIGGGTPSLAKPEEIASLLKACRDSFNIYSDAEITIESNPGTLDREKLSAYKYAGINRISMGLQAWQDKLLRRIGRIHTLDEFLTNLQEARNAGFDNINADLIFGLPDQTIEDWIETIDNVAGLKLSHISCYSLKVEEGTRFFDEYEKDGLILPDEDAEREMYAYAIDKLAGKRYEHYEISNFALKGYECRHNILYWSCGRYIGLGTGAHSYYGGKRFNNVINIEKYKDQIRNGIFPVEKDEMQYISREESMKEFMLLGLRMIKGVSREEFEKLFGRQIEDVFGSEIGKLIEQGLLEKNGPFLRLTRRGLDLANEAFIMFV